MKVSYHNAWAKFQKLRCIFFLLALINITLTGKVNSDTNDEVKSDEIMSSIQFGILNAVELASQYHGKITEKDLMDKKVLTMEDSRSVVPPYRESHKCEFTIYSPKVFKHIREIVGVDDNDFISSMYKLTLKKIQNSDQSGALFYKSGDDKFILRTVKKKEAKLLQESLCELLKNYKYNPNSLLTKYLGLYAYSSPLTTKMVVVINNLLPSNIRFYQIYDLKGSTYNRDASELEKKEKNPTLKDNDFIRKNPGGIYVEDTIHTALSEIIREDCKLLERLHVTNYSLLLGIYNIDHDTEQNSLNAIQNSRNSSSKFGVIPAVNTYREKLLLYMGIIDILTYYGTRKKLEYILKSTIHGNSTSVQSPNSYAERFHNFITKSVLRPKRN